MKLVAHTPAKPTSFDVRDHGPPQPQVPQSQDAQGGASAGSEHASGQNGFFGREAGKGDRQARGELRVASPCPCRQGVAVRGGAQGLKPAEAHPNPTGAIIFETGYGPSGLPHIGTFGEVVRTTMVRHAFRVLTEDKIPTRLICFSDDMDGLRKVPDNVPNKDMLAEHLGKPLTQVPDPFGEHPSFGHHNNARLKAFLDTFGFDYEFLSATDYYVSGRFDVTLLKVLENYEAIRGVIMPTLGPERRATYSPFLPISPLTGKVLQVPIVDFDVAGGTVLYKDPDTGKLTRCRSPTAIASCNGRPTGRCAGRRWASITRWRART